VSINRLFGADPELIWLDPGSTTGLCYVSIDPVWLAGQGDAGFADLGMSIVKRQRCEFGRKAGHRGELDIAELVERFLNRHPDAAIGTEGFKAKAAAGGLSKEALSPVRITAMIEALEAIHGAGRELFTQPVSLATDTVSTDQCREAGLWWPGHKDYNMAARHALTFLRRARHDRKLRESAWPDLEW